MEFSAIKITYYCEIHPLNGNCAIYSDAKNNGITELGFVYDFNSKKKVPLCQKAKS